MTYVELSHEILLVFYRDNVKPCDLAKVCLQEAGQEWFTSCDVFNCECLAVLFKVKNKR